MIFFMSFYGHELLLSQQICKKRLFWNAQFYGYKFSHENSTLKIRNKFNILV